MRGKSAKDFPNIMVVDYLRKKIEFKPKVYLAKLIHSQEFPDFNFLGLALDQGSWLVLKWAAYCLQERKSPADLVLERKEAKTIGVNITLEVEDFPVNKFARDKANPFSFRTTKIEKIERMELVVNSADNMEIDDEQEADAIFSERKFILSCASYDPANNLFVEDQPVFKLPAVASFCC